MRGGGPGKSVVHGPRMSSLRHWRWKHGASLYQRITNAIGLQNHTFNVDYAWRVYSNAALIMQLLLIFRVASLPLQQPVFCCFYPVEKGLTFQNVVGPSHVFAAYVIYHIYTHRPHSLQLGSCYNTCKANLIFYSMAL